MSRIARKTQLIFGSSAGTNQIAQFGSLAASAPAFTTDPAVIQALANYLTGWFGAVIGANSPAIEDMNAFCYLVTYQLASIFQDGIPQWDSGTTYYTGSIVQDGSGNIYSSLQNTNLNNALTSTAYWRPVGSAYLVAINPGVSSPYAITTADNGKTFLVNSANGAMQFNLPAPVANLSFMVKDLGGSFGTNNCTIARHSTETIEGVGANYVIAASGAEVRFACDGTNWYIIGR